MIEPTNLQFLTSPFIAVAKQILGAVRVGVADADRGVEEDDICNCRAKRKERRRNRVSSIHFLERENKKSTAFRWCSYESTLCAKKWEENIFHEPSSSFFLTKNRK